MTPSTYLARGAILDDNIDSLSFEQAMAELESLVKRLEDGRLPLEEAIVAFERGSLLKKYCEHKLLAAKMRVEQIARTPDGSVKTETFNAA
jgi:exodeoxyribonuclease VII small subunit